MIEPARIDTFTAPETYQTTIRKLRNALAHENLRVPFEFNASAQIKQELGIGVVGECTILYVDSPVLLLEATMLHRAAALFIPTPIVLAGGEAHTRIMLRGANTLPSDIGLPARVREPILDLHNRVVKAVRTITNSRNGGRLIRNQLTSA